MPYWLRFKVFKPSSPILNVVVMKRAGVYAGSLVRLKRELMASGAESLEINTGPRNPHINEINEMLSDRKLCLSLREKFHLF